MSRFFLATLFPEHATVVQKEIPQIIVSHQSQRGWQSGFSLKFRKDG
jgi:hypothetical protein